MKISALPFAIGRSCWNSICNVQFHVFFWCCVIADGRLVQQLTLNGSGKNHCKYYPGLKKIETTAHQWVQVHSLSSKLTPVLLCHAWLSQFFRPGYVIEFYCKNKKEPILLWHEHERRGTESSYLILKDFIRRIWLCVIIYFLRGIYFI